MELKLSEKEVKDILLKWAETAWPQSFDEVDIDASYGHLSGVTLSKSEPKEAEE